MKITVFGANGRVGRQVVRLLIQDEHSVRAFVHGDASVLQSIVGVEIVQGDAHDSSAVVAAVSGSDAVISTLGSWHTATKDILTSAMQQIIPAMQGNGIRRIVSLTGAAARSQQDNENVIDKLNHTLLRGVAPQILSDGERHIDLLASSQLDWTVLRSPIMTRDHSEKYKLSMQSCMPWETIARTAVARALVDQLTDDTYVQQTPFLHQ